MLCRLLRCILRLLRRLSPNYRRRLALATIVATIAIAVKRRHRNKSKQGPSLKGLDEDSNPIHFGYENFTDDDVYAYEVLGTFSLGGPESPESPLDLLYKNKVFAALEKNAVIELYRLMEEIVLADGQNLFKAGDDTDQGLYVVMDGSVEVYTIDELNQYYSLYEVHTSDDLCIHSLFSDSGTIQTLSARAVHGRARCLYLSRTAFRSFCTGNVQHLDALIRIIIGRNWRVITQVLTSYLKLPAMSKSESQGEEKFAIVDVTEEVLKSALSLNPAFSYETVCLEPGQVLFEQGESVSAFYILLSGLLLGVPKNESDQQFDNDQSWTHQLHPSSVVGIMSFMTGCLRGETVKAIEQSRLIRISKGLYHHLLEHHQQCVLPLLFAAGKQLSALATQFFSFGLHSTWFKGGSVIRETPTQVENNPNMYLIISGRVRVSYARSSQKKEFAEIRRENYERTTGFDQNSMEIYNELTQQDLSVSTTSIGRGETFAESRTFSKRGSETAQVQAVCERDTELVAISRATLRNIMMRYPLTIGRFMEIMSKKLSQLEQDSLSNKDTRSQRNLKTISLVSAGSTPVSEVAAFALRLTASLSDLGPTMLLNSQRLPRFLGRDIARQIRSDHEMFRLSLWLAQQEESYRFVILETDGGPSISFWDSFCIRQSDCVVLVGRQGALPVPGLYERRMLRYADLRRKSICLSPYGAGPQSDKPILHCTLVIIHPDWVPVPSKTKAWLDQRQLKSWHHVRVCHEADYARFSRYISGTSIGLVLSGGGCRGLAHLGVLKALHEANIKVDCIGGTSQGAFMGALYSACNMDLGKVEPIVRHFSSKFNRLQYLLAATFPMLSLSNGYAFSEAVKEALGANLFIEDLWLPYFANATNVGRSNSSSLFRGPLWKLVRASMSLLGLLPPVIYNGDVLVDGGYTNNLPVDVMNKSFGPQTVIAVDVEDRDNAALINLYDYGEGISGWWILLQKLNPFDRRKIPGFYDILIWLNCINHNRQLRLMDHENIDIYVRPNIHRFGLLEYNRFDDIVQAGYEAARVSIKRWMQTNAEAERDILTSAKPASGIVKSRSMQVESVGLLVPKRDSKIGMIRVGSFPYIDNDQDQEK